MVDPHQERRDFLQRVIVQTEKMVGFLSAPQRSECEEILRFLNEHGCYGFPSGMDKSFGVGSWIGRAGFPSHQLDAVTVIPCFADEVPPGLPATTDVISPGCFLRSDQVIILYNVDRWSNTELALTLFHEARHARHRLGFKLAKLQPLDADEFHEGNTWLCMMSILNVWGKANWQRAVRREVDWLVGQSIVSPDASQIIYLESPTYWPELDRVFGKTKHEHSRTFRRKLVSLQANMNYWSHRYKALIPEQICHSIVRNFYK